MPSQPKLLTRQRGLILATLLVFLASVYMLTYGGRIESGDSFYLFDATGSLLNFGDFKLDLSASTRPLQLFRLSEPVPLETVDAEPLQIILAAPLYWLADRLPGIGLTHAVWLFNVFVSAAAGGVIFLYALALGYDERTGVLAALMFGLGTIILPYSKTFFREPLTLLMILLAAFFAERWRASRYRSKSLLAALLLAAAGALLSKATAVLAFPALLVIALPPVSRANQRRIGVMLALAALVVGGVFAGMALWGDQLGIGRRYNLPARLIEGSLEYFPVALHSYLFSIGGSIWGTSPIGLLALPGLWLLARQGRLRYVVAVPLMILAFAFGYALTSGSFWFGGLSWPPRFLVPAAPFLIIGALPAVSRLLRSPAPRLLIVVTAVLMVYSLWVQFAGVSLWWGAYTEVLPDEAGGLLEWGGGLNDARWLRWVVLPQLWGRAYPFDFAWVRVPTPLWVGAFGLLALASGVWLWRLTSLAQGDRVEKRGWRRAAAATAALALVFFPLVYLGLRAIYVDSYYYPNREGLFPMLPVIEAETGEGDILFLSNREYERFFLQYGKFRDVRVITLPFQYGDRLSESHAPRVVSSNPDLLMRHPSMALIERMAATHDRLWLLEDRGPDLAWAVRPVEQFMAAHYYPIRVIQTDPTVRLIEYDTTSAPDPYAYRTPDVLLDLVYGGDLRLLGYTLPRGTTYHAGESLPLSLYWQADEPIERDYHVAWFLRTEDGAPVTQAMDWQPGGGFSRTSAWRAGVPMWDNRALRLPADLPPGNYQLWVKVYSLDADFAPQDAAAAGDAVSAADPTLGILPTRIVVE